MMNASGTSSTRPYLIRALYEWCTDNGLTPYVAVRVDDSVRVPREYVKDGEIVLNISMDAVSALTLGNDFIEFKARFGGVARDIAIPLGRVMAIYARENGQGMAFPLEDEASGLGARSDVAQIEALDGVKEGAEPDGNQDVPVTGDVVEQEPPRPGGGRPTLKRVK